VKNFYLLFFAVFFLSACSDAKLVEISGKTMGTTYTVKVIAPKKYSKDKDLKTEIDKILKKINSAMSIYDKSSEISVFNKLEKNVYMKISSEFLSVLVLGQKIYNMTNGAWDGTVGHLVNLWGFGNQKNKFEIPSQFEINEKLALTGFDKIVILADEMKIKKNINNIFLDLGSIAKGFGVDFVSDFLKDEGFSDFMVEIGGEVYVSGQNIKKEKWKIGINVPDSSAGLEDVISIINISDKGVATSGTYRNFFKTHEKIYSHIIDPKTGRPVNNSLLSVTVISGSCTFADGLATGMLVMGADKAIELCNGIENTECMTIENQNGFKVRYSRGFKKFVNMGID